LEARAVSLEAVSLELAARGQRRISGVEAASMVARVQVPLEVRAWAATRRVAAIPSEDRAVIEEVKAALEAREAMAASEVKVAMAASAHLLAAIEAVKWVAEASERRVVAVASSEVQ